MNLTPALLTEATCDLILNYLKSSFNSYLADSDFQYSDGINLESVDSYYISEQFDTLQLPALYVLMGEMAFQYSDKPNYLNSEDDVVVVLSQESVELEELNRRAWRYGRILHGVLNQQDLQTQDKRLKIKIIPTRLGYSENVIRSLPNQEKRFRKDTVLMCKVLHYEENQT